MRMLRPQTCQKCQQTLLRSQFGRTPFRTYLNVNNNVNNEIQYVNCHNTIVGIRYVKQTLPFSGRKHVL